MDFATDEALEGLDTLANLAILEEGHPIATPGHVTTKHPRHKIGCSCIVCKQSPSGKGFKHKHTCECAVCLTVKRRFKTLMLRREKKQQENNQESASEKKDTETQSVLEKSQENKVLTDERLNTPSTLKDLSCEVSGYHSCGKNSSGSSLKCQIDLNIKPERDDSVISGGINAFGSSPLTEADDRMEAAINNTVMEVAEDQRQTLNVDGCS